MKNFLYLCLTAASLGLCAALATGNTQALNAVQERIYSNFTVFQSNVLTPFATPPLVRDATCGKKNLPSLTGRIAGGNVATPNEYPWQAFLQISQGWPVFQDYVCGGTLISNQWILTAANCLDGASLIKVYLGAHDLTATNEWQRVIFTTTDYKKHPSWNAQTLNGDIALIKLPVPVNFTSYIKPICLPSTNDPSHNGDTVYLTGWGRTSGSGSVGPLSPVLRETTTTVIGNSECSSIYGNVVTDNIICSSGAGGRGICPSDNGGPMGYMNADGTFTQIGVASFYAAAGCENSLPSGFTRIRNYVNWISQETSIPVLNSAVSNSDSSCLKFILAIAIAIQCYFFDYVLRDGSIH